MNLHEFFFIAVFPLSLVVSVVICVGAFLAYGGLSKRWEQSGSTKSTRNKEIAALVLATVSTLLFVLVGNLYIDALASEAKLRGAVQQETAMAVRLRVQIAAELEAVREVLIDRTQRQITDGRLAEARSELVRFIPLKDQQIMKMIALIDQELEIRKLLEQSGWETAPLRLASVYARLAELAPDSADYKSNAARYLAIAKSHTAAAAALPNKPASSN